jgi:hypothetical protein
VYTPPGVLIDENAQPVPNINSTVAIPPSRVALVGPSIGYQTFTESVALAATTPQALTKKGIDAGSIVVKNLAGSTMAVTVDYTVAQSGSPAEEASTTVARINGGALSDGQVVYVTYNYTDSSFYLPYLATDWDQIQTRFGAAVDTSTGTVSSPLSLAAKIVMEQGVREMLLVPTKGSSPTLVTAAQLVVAYAMLESRDDVGMVVPLPIGIAGTDGSPGETLTVFTNLRTFVETQSAQGNYCIGICGLDTGGVRTYSSIAASIASKRVVIAYPYIFNWYNGLTNTILEVGGCYAAAAMAGRLSANMPQEPLTRKQISGFSSIPARVVSTMTRTAKNDLSSAGVSVIEQTPQGSLVVRHGVTSDRSSVLTREISIMRAKDTMLKLVFAALDQAGVIGTPLTDETPIRVQSLVEGALTQAQNAGIFNDFSNLSVRVDPDDQTALQVKYAYRPTYPLNYITVSFSINTVTGNQTEA